MILKACIEKLMHGQHLDSASCRQVIDELLKPSTNPLQISAFLVLLRAKKETADELSVIVDALREKMIKVKTPYEVLDIVGTGGDGMHTINISTGSAMLAASCGVKVAKHGNRSVSSMAGSADLLEALGINIHLLPDQVAQSIEQIGIGFCYSPNFHPVAQSLRNISKKLNVPTTFNLLGPLLNPANTSHIILGVMDEALMPIMADVIIQKKCRRSVVVHGMGMDEISTAGPTKILEINDTTKNEYILDPEMFGFERCQVSDLRGGDPKMNAKLLLDTFNGKRGPIADTLILNASVALYLTGLSSSVAEAIPHASKNLYNGSVITLLNKWIEFTHEQ